MSNLGLNSSYYHTTRNYLEILNRFLVDLNYSREVGKEFDSTEVIEFFKKLIDKNNHDANLWLIRSVFNSYFREINKDAQKEMTLFISDLIQGHLDKQLIADVETFVDLLKSQCEESYARIKGKD